LPSGKTTTTIKRSESSLKQIKKKNKYLTAVRGLRVVVFNQFLCRKHDTV